MQVINFENSVEFARTMDREDPLGRFRERFLFPDSKDGELIYFVGNSLGLQPNTVRQNVEQELDDWHRFGVEGHFRAKNPWYYYHHFTTESLARLTGARKEEVVAMNALTVNLNLLMISFYQPDRRRSKILIEQNAFPSDYYAVEQQIRLHGFDPETCLIEMKDSGGADILQTGEIIKQIHAVGDELALVMFGGVNYYSGQLFDMRAITTAAHDVGAFAGFDLAHAIGNAPLELNEWGVDFAVWCSYKYLNAGPGGVGGAFVHERHKNNFDLPRMAGWWGNDEESRFMMPQKFQPQAGIAGWQMSNAPVLPMAVLRSSLDIFDEAGMPALRSKSEMLTGYLEYLIEHRKSADHNFRIITPREPSARGCQLSIQTDRGGKALFEKLTAEGVVADWREPDVIRVAPVPLYNTFEEVYRFAEILTT